MCGYITSSPVSAVVYSTEQCAYAAGAEMPPWPVQGRAGDSLTLTHLPKSRVPHLQRFISSGSFRDIG